MTSLSNVVLWCDVQLTKDGAGICFPDMKLDNASDISVVFKNRNNVYLVNGVSTPGWFSVDFTLTDLETVALNQGVYSRSNRFDGNLFPILTVQEMVKLTRPPGLWLNVQHDVFYTKHNLSMRTFVLSVSKSVIVDYISSPEVAFLRGVSQRFKATKTKLIFRFLEKEETDPSTNQTYGSLLNNLTFIKTFASGILVPKGYIWPVDKNSYLESSTLVVQNAHKEGLEVFGSDFINDIPFSYNYSYDPIAEVLNFIDNDAFSVDGVLSDFPITPSAAIDCFAHIGKNASGQEKPLIISYNGASGDYPSCTDLAYTKAISDGVDVLDCNVQMTKDGTPICLSSINLMDSTKVAQTPFSNLTTTIPEVQKGSGIFTFNLTWEDISSLTPAISNPYSTFRLSRNPAAKTAGKLVSLSDFLSIAKEANSLSGGVLIGIEHAAFLVKVGLSVTDAVLDALSKAGYDNVTTPRVMIQSTNSSVLKEFKEKKKNYELVYRVDENIRDASDATIEDIKKFATSVVISKDSIYPENKAFITGATDIVSRLQKNNLPVYVQHFDNEFISQAWDFFSDATVEINSFVTGAGIDGVITSFPQTAASYRKNPCLKYKTLPSYMSPVQPGSLMQVITSDDMPPALAPYPVLKESDVAEPPLQEVAPATPASSTNAGTTAPAPTSPNGQPRIATCIVLSNLAVLLVTVLLL
ncbi:glycerophosphodiester phosphodiesterase GDPDL4 isoform X2 [Vitis riparia]|nr:glycerophosphodiester phosphodiesterase GDPDL4 isoform X2 [Vitis riparia]